MPEDYIPRKDKRGTFELNAERFAMAQILNAINDAAQKTSEWLRENYASIDAHGTPDEDKPWFDEQRFASPYPLLKGHASCADNPCTECHKLGRMAEKERHCSLDAKVYEHGVAKFAYELSKRNVLVFERDDPKTLVFLRSGEVEGWFHVLVRYSWVGITMNLEEFRDTGDYNPNTPQAHAKAKLEDLSEVGFVLVSKQKSYSIIAGPVARVFYEQVWFPITEEFKVKIREFGEGKR
jgi:hypothetical protein